MVTEQDIARVALELEQAQDTVNALKLKRWTSKEAGAAYAAAKGRIELAEQELGRLNAQYEAEQLALENRPNVEKAAAKDINAAQKELEESREQLTSAATAAQQALVDLHAAGEAHSALVARHSAALTVRGLALDEQHDHATGGGRDAVRLRGTMWPTVDPATLLVWVMHRAVAACLPRANVLAATLNGYASRHRLEHRTDQLLAQVPVLPQRQTTRVPRPERGHLGATVYIGSVYEEEERIKAQLTGWTTTKEKDGVMYTDRAEPSESVKASVAHQIELLHEGVKSGHIIPRRK